MFKTKRLMIATAVAMVLAGCSGNGGQNEPAPTTVSTTKDTLILSSGAEPTTLDPQLSEETIGMQIIRQMMEGLVSTDHKTGKTIPGLAQSWENTDNKVWTFYLRDANWSNGDPITAQDAVFALKRLVDPNTAAPYGTFLADAKVLNAEAIANGEKSVDELGVAALDDKTLQITLSESVPYFADMLAIPVTFPVHQKSVEAFGERWLSPENIVVSGAYKLDNWAVNDSITLVKNDAYYDAANTSIAKVQFLPITSDNSINRYFAGEVDVSGIPPEKMEFAQQKAGDQLHTKPSLCSFYLEPNLKVAPFDDKRVRQALSMTIDRDTIVKLFKRDEPTSYQFTPKQTQGIGEIFPVWYNLDTAARNEEAKKLLAEAGFTKDNPLRFEFLYDTSKSGKMYVSAIASMWKENLDGAVETEQVNQEWKTFLDSKNQGKFSLATGGWCADYNEPSTFLNVLKSTSSNNSGGYANPAFDKLLNDTLVDGISNEMRMQLYKDAEKLLAEDTIIIPVYTSVSKYLAKPYIEGIVEHQDPLWNYLVKDLSLKTE